MDGSAEVTKSMFDDDDDDDDDGSGSGSLLSNLTEALLGSGSGSGEDGSGSEEELEEFVVIDEKLYYLEPILRGMAVIHSIISFCMMIAYYNLKVPLAIFKREKEVARAMEFDGMYISEEPPEDEIKARWDKLVISTRSFPVNYWDKFVKKRVRQKYSETFDVEQLSTLLGMSKGGLQEEEKSGGIFSL